MWLYVLGHEFTHALAAMLAGGKVSAFQVSAKGGHVVTDRVNWWITLSPYFVPIYALIWMALWLTVDFCHPLKAWQPILYFGIGVFWCFHLTFTVSMLHLGQTDLSGQGIVFSARHHPADQPALLSRSCFSLARARRDLAGAGRALPGIASGQSYLWHRATKSCAAAPGHCGAWQQRLSRQVRRDNDRSIFA